MITKENFYHSYRRKILLGGNRRLGPVFSKKILLIQGCSKDKEKWSAHQKFSSVEPGFCIYVAIENHQALRSELQIEQLSRLIDISTKTK